MIDRELYQPERWADDPERCRAARIPAPVGFRTKPELARVMLERALAAGVPASWVTADQVYGGDPALRGWLEDRGVSYVLAVKCTERLEASSPNGVVREGADQLAAPAAPGMARWLLVRRRSDGELAFSACSGPAGTSLVGLVGWPGPAGRSKKASSRPRARSAWTTTRSASGRAGIATSPWPCWAHAFLAVTRAQATTGERTKGDTAARAAGSACCR